MTSGAVTEIGGRSSIEVAARQGTDRRHSGPDQVRRPRLRALPVAAGLYLLLSVVVWWNVWSTHPTSVTTCGCGDGSLFTWFIEWPAYALSHGLDPWYSTAMFHPNGVNLLSNTSEVAVGVVLAPVTWLFGPVASLNVALTLSPALSALAMFALLRRWVSWSPAAFVGGLLYGFSPLVIVNLADAHLMAGLLVIPPLAVACLDELLFRQRRSPILTGVVLGLLCVVQFFIGTEILAIMVITGAIGIALVAGYAALRHPLELRRRAGHAVKAIGAAATVAAVLLAYPTWFALAGPAHLSGLIWPTVKPGFYGIGFPALVRLNSTAPQELQAQRLGGYQGYGLHQGEYLGLGLILVVAVGLLVWRRDRRLWLFGMVGVICVALSLTVATQVNSFWVPWRVLLRVPVVQNILPDRFMAMTFLCAAVLLGLIVDHCHRSVLEGWDRSPGASPSRIEPASWRPRVVAASIAVAVALLAVVPTSLAYADSLPLVLPPVVLPQWFSTVAPHLAPGQVVLTYPNTFGGFQSSLTWQAVDRMSFSLVEGGGPGGVLQRAGTHRDAYIALGNAAFILDPSTAYTAATIATVRQAVITWGVTTVVIPDQPELPAYEQGFHTSYTVGLMTAALGVGPRFDARAWTWTVGRTLLPSLPVNPDAFRQCVGTSNYRPGPPQTVPDCMLGKAG
ncbi:MAG TPA: hypothetical protein VND67_00945 [Acidimicrobiales bacterium]|nr:hypothetical protein [Acidimicrobiales bacterium]